MNHIITIDGTDYKFHFGHRVYWYLSNSGEIEYDEIDGRITSDFDSYLRLFTLANESAVRKDGGEQISVSELEFAMDENPSLRGELENALSNSKVIEKMQETMEEEAEPVGNEKKSSD